jgi:hypothetical protein
MYDKGSLQISCNLETMASIVIESIFTEVLKSKYGDNNLFRLSKTRLCIAISKFRDTREVLLIQISKLEVRIEKLEDTRFSKVTDKNNLLDNAIDKEISELKDMIFNSELSNIDLDIRVYERAIDILIKDYTPEPEIEPEVDEWGHIMSNIAKYQ